MSEGTTPPPITPRRRISAPTVVLILAAIAGAAGYYFYVRAENQTAPVDEFSSLKGYFERVGRNQTLSPEYTDANADLLADAPADAAKWQSVKELGFSAIGTDDPDRLKAEEADWKDLMAAIAKSTGKPVVYRSNLNGVAMQMNALRDGTLHITAFNTGAVTEAVNTAGFVPLFAPASDDGQFGIRMEILVKASSSMSKPEDLRGKSLGFVALSSNSGAKAPMFVLKDKFGMLPARDYRYRITGDHFASLVSLIETDEFDAVCVASDLKDRAFAAPFQFRGQEKRLDAAAVRVIYTSEPVPPLCFGVPHNLPPELRGQIEKALTEYRFAGTSAAKYAKQGKTQFASVNYKKDWKYVREIDAALSRFADLP